MSEENQNTCFILHFYLKGLNAPLTYEVDQKVSERLDKFVSFISDEPSKDIASKFFVFEARNGMKVIVSVRDIQVVHYAWQSVALSAGGHERGANSLLLYLRGKPEPLQLTFANSLSAYDFLTDLDSADYESEEFINFSNDDAEQTTVRINEIVLVEVSAMYVREGEEVFKDSRGD